MAFTFPTLKFMYFYVFMPSCVRGDASHFFAKKIMHKRKESGSGGAASETEMRRRRKGAPMFGMRQRRKGALESKMIRMTRRARWRGKGASGGRGAPLD